MPEKYTPQRVVSLQPSITVTLRDLELLPRLVACTKYCVDVCPEVDETGCIIVEDSWSAKAEQILAGRPDLVFASVPYQLEAVAQIMKAGVPFLGLAPRSLDDVYKDILLIGRVMDAQSRSEFVVEQMQKAIAAVLEQTVAMDKPLVYCEEWGKPLLLSQAWVAELVEAAGGRFFGAPGKQTTTDEVRAADPDVMIAAWCGAGDRVPLEKIVARPGWENIKAAKNGRVYCIQDDLLNTPASTLIGGLRALAAAIHPEACGAERGLRRIQSEAPVRNLVNG